MNWYRNYRPRVHYWFWFILECLNIGLLLLVAWVAYKFPDVDFWKQIIVQSLVATFCYMMTRYWKHWINNPVEYEKLQQARIRRFGRRTDRPPKKKKKDTED